MVGEPDRRRRLIAAVAALYDWLDEQLRRDPGRAGRCEACGACCDFAAYDHRLFVLLKFALLHRDRQILSYRHKVVYKAYRLSIPHL